MIFISILAGLLSSMSVWADKWDDVRLSLNDFYMASLMAGWMILLEGAFMKDSFYMMVGTIFILFFFYCIRTQLFVDVKQYLRGMIPHHSMAVFMSKHLINKYGQGILEKLPQNIIRGQESEIRFMKNQFI